MNELDQPGFDPRIADWLEDDPDLAPDEALRVVLAAVPSIRQTRGLAARWRFISMQQTTKVALGLVAVVAIAVGAAYLIQPKTAPGVGGPASPSPVTTGASPSAAGAASVEPSGSGLEGEPTILTVTATDTDCTAGPGELDEPLPSGTVGWITVSNTSTRAVFFQLDKAADAAVYGEFRLYMQAEHQRATEGKPLVGPATMVDLGASRLVAAGATDRFLGPTLPGLYGIACLPEVDNVVVDAYLVGPLTVAP